MKLAQLLEGLEYELLSRDGTVPAGKSAGADMAAPASDPDGEICPAKRPAAPDPEISDITNDSRKVVPGALFFAIRGANSDGHAYAAQVAAAGAAVLVVEHPVELPDPAAEHPAELPAQDAASGDADGARDTGRDKVPLPLQVVVPSTRRAMALISAAFYGHPARRLTMIGITGTKGKTTTTYLVKSILESAGIDTGLIGTIEMTYHDVHRSAANTTPESIALQRDLKEMADAGVQAAVMEVSSQALMMDRTAGIQYDIGVFTNLSEDHIGPNEHRDFEDYLHCKSLLFRQCEVGIVNGDDPYVDRILEGSSCRIEQFGTRQTDDLWAVNSGLVKKPGELGIRFDAKGLIDIPDCEVPTPGSFSVYNAMAAVAICRHFDVEEEVIREALRGARTKGRIELIPLNAWAKEAAKEARAGQAKEAPEEAWAGQVKEAPGSQSEAARGAFEGEEPRFEFSLMIDYAHNAVALESLLTTLKEYEPHRLVTLFGCGGNRSRVRRFEMGEVSGRLSDLTIITSDNPRFEEPMDIIADIVTGISKTDGVYVTIPDRKEAIRYAIHHGEPGDLIVLAGKGHEDYQEIRGKKYPMDERVLIREILAEDAAAGMNGQRA